MGQYFLASVGYAEAFRKVNGKPVHFFSAKTLSDSSINISVSAEEVRGGPGAQLLGQFFHTSVFGLSMTDTMFKLEYIEAQVGGKIEQGGYGLSDESVTTGAGGAIALKGTPIELLPGTGAIVWYNRPGTSEYADYVFPEGTTDFTFNVPGAVEGDAYCLHYYANRDDARKLIINSEFVPAELVVFLTTRLYAGDASAPETGKPVGSVTVKIPRFQLNGTTDIAMAMASAATIQIQGNALAYDDDCNGAKYAEIVEYIEVSPYDGYTALTADAETINTGDTPVVYATGSRKIPMVLENSAITFTPALSDGVAPAAGTEVNMSYTYNDVNNNPVEIKGSFTVPTA